MLVIALWKLEKMCEVTDYLSSWMASPSAGESVKRKQLQ